MKSLQIETAYQSVARRIPIFHILAFGFVILASLQDRSAAAVLISNLGQNVDSVRRFGLGGNNGGPPPTVIGMKFSTGATAASLDSIRVRFDDKIAGSPSGGVKAEIYTDFSFNAPRGPSGLIGTFTSVLDPTTADIYEFAGSSLAVAANTTYHLIFSAVAPTGGSDFYAVTASDSFAEDTGGAAGWSLGNFYYVQSADFPDWFEFGPSVVPMLELVTAVPEPSALILGLMGIFPLLRRRR